MNYNGSEIGYEETFRAIDGTDNFLIYGGSSTSSKMNTASASTTGIIVRMDLELYTRRWAKALDGDTNMSKVVEAIAVKANDQDQVAVYARDSRGSVFEQGHN